MEKAVILSACRTPIGSFGGVFRDLSAVDLGAVVTRDAIRRAHIEPGDLGDVIMGCVLQAGAGMNVARQASLRAGVPVEVPAETVNRVCGSGLQAVVHGVEGVKAGYIDLILAGGTESMSNAPYLMKGARWGYPDGQRRGRRLDAAGGPYVLDQRVPHGHDRRGGRETVQRLARRSGRLCRRKPGARREGRRLRSLRSRNRPCGGASEEGGAGRRVSRRVPCLLYTS